MKKNCVILCALLIIGVGAIQAQYVTIPDANFVTYLNTIVPSAMTGNQMDTTNPVVAGVIRIDVENMGILDLTGVQYFRNLVTLDCGNGSPSVDSNHITSLPTLAVTLDTLICGNNQITSLPTLPAGLTILKCYINKLTSLPTLPANLIYLDCSTNKLTSLPTLSVRLTYIDCSYNKIISLPALPVSLIELICQFNQMTGLPTLSSPLSELFCDYNRLTSLPALPASLTELNCSSNQIASLPTLPGSLSMLACGSNQITNLPTLPRSLTELFCDNNQISTLPNLPNTLFELFCNNNNISCFPEFPNSLVDSNIFLITPNPFTCLPNYVPGMPRAILAYPICAPGNPNNCAYAYGIIGFTYNDMNNDCIKDSGDNNLVNIPVQLYDNSNNLLGQTYTAINGVYDFPDTGAIYKVSIDTTGMPYKVQCVHPGVDSVLSIVTLDSNVNFSFTCKSGFDVGVQSVMDTGLVFPGLKHDLSVVAGDMTQWYNLNCANGDSGTVQITVSGPVTYVGPGAGALTPIVSGNVYTYHISNYSSINNNTAFNLILKTDTNAKAGDTICVYVTVTPLIDNNPANNTYQYCYYVVNSHDPNNKTVYPVDVAPGYTGWFTYTIHFQNTGNAAAQNILISDTLASNLDLSTFQLISYKYPNTPYLKGNVLTFEFSNIDLPDSAANPTGSIGFVQYRIKPKGGLPNGTTIKNTGYIYFDNNTAIITDTTINLFTKKVTSVNTIVNDVTCKVFPNPNKGEFTVLLQNTQSQCHVLIYNELGQEIYSSELNNGNTQVNIPNKVTGVYFYRIVTESESLVSDGKIVVE